MPTREGETEMKKVFCLAFTLTLCLSLLPTALAAETTFTDVPAGSWFEQGVALCAQSGIMVGTGEGQFSPNHYKEENFDAWYETTLEYGKY